jgi:copper transport protein
MTIRHRGGLRRRIVGLGALLLGLLGAALLLAGPASAHATLEQAKPSDGSRLKLAPKTVTLTFDENVGLGTAGYVHVTDKDGNRVDAKAAYHPGGDGQQVADDLRDSLGDGTYTVSWRVVSADSHPVAGTLRFVVGSGPLVATSAGGGGATVDHVTSATFEIVRWLSYAGFALLGGSWLLLTVWPAGRDDVRARRLVGGGWLISVLGGVLALLLQGPYAAGTSLAHVADWSLLDGTLHSNFGQLLSLRLVLLGLVAVLLGRAMQPDAVEWIEDGGRWFDGARRVELFLWPAAAAVAATFSGVGHPDTTNPRWLSIILDALHVLAMSAWLGGLVLLLVAILPRQEAEELHAVLPVFSKVAFLAVGTLAITGTYAAWRGIGAWDAVFGTTYGWLVVAKVALFLGLLAVGNLSRRLVLRRATLDGATRRLGRAVTVEAMIGLVVLGFTAVLVSQPRGTEALAADDRKPITASASLGGGRSITLTLDPGVHGSVNAEVELSSPAQSVTVTATEKAKQLGPIPLKLTAEGRTLYSATGVGLPVSGRWEFDFVVTRSKFDAVTTDITINLH